MCSQIRCGDLYSDKAVSTFNSCAVSDKKCVPQRVDESTYPVPKDEVLVKSFPLNEFEVGTADLTRPFSHLRAYLA